MSISIKCPDCAAQLSAPGELRGQSVQCPRCRGRFVVGVDDRAPSESPSNREPNSANEVMHAGAQITPRSVASTRRRAGRRAKFIAGQAAPARGRLAADGELPSLVLGTAPRPARRAEAHKNLRPGLLMAAFVFSLSATAVLLSVDVQSGSSSSRSKAAARRLLAEYYLNAPLERYQKVLRKAQQAHRLGNIEYERRLYREVLDMLHAEGHNEFQGLTGAAKAEHPPNDRHLEQLLSTLLAD